MCVSIDLGIPLTIDERVFHLIHIPRFFPPWPWAQVRY